MPTSRKLRGIVGVAPIALAFMLVTCSDEPEPVYEEPAGWDSEIAVPPAVDLNPDPHVLEVNLVAKEADLEIKKGKITHVYTFDGGIPGPLLEVTAGDRLIVHFTNQLPEPTTIHWHGVRLPVEMDGVPDHSQAPVPPGGTFEYDFIVPDAGLFWYHPHVESSKQVGFGLYGPLLSHAADDSEKNLPKDEELVLVLSDLGVADDGSIVDPYSGGDIGSLFGREGNVILANGKRLPRLVVRSGVTQRWRIVNAARSRYFQIALPGTQFVRIGGDNGLIEHPVTQDKLILTPGQRADVLVTPVNHGEGLTFLMWIPFDRGFGSTEFRANDEIMAIDFDDVPGPEPRPTPQVGRTIERLDTTGAKTVKMQLTQTTDEMGHLSMGINGVPFDQAVPFTAAVGETQIWEIENTIEYSHPFHLHGFFFQEITDPPLDPLEWHDTIDIPLNTGKRRIAVRFDDRPGHWMFHCHVLDHADAGMMGMVDVAPRL